MTRFQPMPEDVRGCWVASRPEDSVSTLAQKKHDAYAFDIDGAFRHHTVKACGEVTQKEEGHYTFDGQFLILRGRRTHTFRVQPVTPWQWKLEGKKKTLVLTRGYIEARDFHTLGGDKAQELALIARRFRFHTALQGPDPIWRLIKPERGDDLPLAILSMDISANSSAPWVGVTPLVTGISAESWERILSSAAKGTDIPVGPSADLALLAA